jgi:tRNA (cmo5U34)-methyltransferase
MSEQPIDFDKNAPVAGKEYDTLIAKALPGYDAMHLMALSCLRSQLSEKANLLIVGAGTGVELVRFGTGNSHWQMLGVDPSVNMLSIAEDKIKNSGLSERVQLFKGYTQDLPADSIYDAATAILVMHFIPDDGSKLAFLQSIAQRLKPSATFILVDVFGKKGSPELERTTSILQCLWEDTGIPLEKRVELIENFDKRVYPITEARLWELLQQVDFCNILKFYTGLWVGGWMATKI